MKIRRTSIKKLWYEKPMGIVILSATAGLFVRGFIRLIQLVSEIIKIV